MIRARSNSSFKTEVNNTSGQARNPVIKHCIKSRKPPKELGAPFFLEKVCCDSLDSSNPGAKEYFLMIFFEFALIIRDTKKSDKTHHRIYLTINSECVSTRKNQVCSLILSTSRPSLISLSTNSQVVLGNSRINFRFSSPNGAIYAQEAFQQAGALPKNSFHLVSLLEDTLNGAIKDIESTFGKSYPSQTVLHAVKEAILTEIMYLEKIGTTQVKQLEVLLKCFTNSNEFLTLGDAKLLDEFYDAFDFMKDALDVSQENFNLLKPILEQCIEVPEDDSKRIISLASILGLIAENNLNFEKEACKASAHAQSFLKKCREIGGEQFGTFLSEMQHNDKRNMSLDDLTVLFVQRASRRPLLAENICKLAKELKSAFTKEQISELEKITAITQDCVRQINSEMEDEARNIYRIENEISSIRNFSNKNRICKTAFVNAKRSQSGLEINSALVVCNDCIVFTTIIPTKTGESTKEFYCVYPIDKRDKLFSEPEVLKISNPENNNVTLTIHGGKLKVQNDSKSEKYDEFILGPSESLKIKEAIETVFAEPPLTNPIALPSKPTAGSRLSSLMRGSSDGAKRLLNTRNSSGRGTPSRQASSSVRPSSSNEGRSSFTAKQISNPNVQGVGRSSTPTMLQQRSQSRQALQVSAQKPSLSSSTLQRPGAIGSPSIGHRHITTEAERAPSRVARATPLASPKPAPPNSPRARSQLSLKIPSSPRFSSQPASPRLSSISVTPAKQLPSPTASFRKMLSPNNTNRSSSNCATTTTSAPVMKKGYAATFFENTTTQENQKPIN